MTACSILRQACESQRYVFHLALLPRALTTSLAHVIHSPPPSEVETLTHRFNHLRPCKATCHLSCKQCRKRLYRPHLQGRQQMSSTHPISLDLYVHYSLLSATGTLPLLLPHSQLVLCFILPACWVLQLPAMAGKPQLPDNPTRVNHVYYTDDTTCLHDQSRSFNGAEPALTDVGQTQIQLADTDDSLQLCTRTSGEESCHAADAAAPLTTGHGVGA